MKTLLIILSLMSYAKAEDICFGNEADNIIYCYNADGSYIKENK